MFLCSYLIQKKTGQNVSGPIVLVSFFIQEAQHASANIVLVFTIHLNILQKNISVDTPPGSRLDRT